MRVHIWIRQQDEKAWAAIKNKPEWLHEQLRDKFSYPIMESIEHIEHLKKLGDEALEEISTEAANRLSEIELTKQLDELNAEISKEWALANGWTAPEGKV